GHDRCRRPGVSRDEGRTSRAQRASLSSLTATEELTLFRQRRPAQFGYVSLALLAGASIALTSCASPTRPSASSVGASNGLWHSPNGSCSRSTRALLPDNPRLDGVVVTARCSAWAVGSYTSGRALIERWNGSTWNQVPAPGPKSNSALFAVASTSPDDVW